MPDHDVDREVVRRFRADEPIEGMHRDRLLLLTTTGRRSGTERTTPMMFVLDDDEPVVVASNDGAEHHPAWLLNAREHADVRVELPDGRAVSAVAEELRGRSRDAIWASLTEQYPFFLEHQRRAGDRSIPLVRLHLAG